MERYLGRMVGGVGALLLVCTLPFMTTTSSVGGTMTTPSHQTAASSWTKSQTISIHQGESAKERVRKATQLARSRVGGGQVLAIRPQSPFVWNIIIQQHSRTFNVTTTLPNYKVVDVQSLSL